MGLAKPKTQYYTLEQYLKIERGSVERNEFIDGEIYAMIEHYSRQPNGDWLLREYSGLDTNFRIKTIDCSLTLANIYDRIEFEEEFQEITL